MENRVDGALQGAPGEHGDAPTAVAAHHHAAAPPPPEPMDAEPATPEGLVEGAPGVPEHPTVGPQHPSEEALEAMSTRHSATAARLGGQQQLMDAKVAQRRLMQDLRSLQQTLSSPAGEQLGIMARPSEGNIFQWRAVISGPCDTPWEGGLFKLELKFGADYPFAPPKVRFLTRNVFHPNVYVSGDICMDTLKSNWKSSLNVESLLISITSLLSDPNPMSAANGVAAKLLMENRTAYDEKIRELVEESLEQSFSDAEEEDAD